MSAPSSAEDFEKAQAVEYGTYVCVSPIFVGGARAFNPGHPVPVSHVDANPDWLSDGLVEKVAVDSSAPARPAAPAPDLSKNEG
jgi:hypothetical protein